MYKANMKKLNNNMRILEIGHGNGKQLELIKKNKKFVFLYGIDISVDMHNLASKKLGRDANLDVATAEDMPYEDSYFDAVITTDTFYFWDDPSRVMAEIKRVLKQEGLFINAHNTMYASSVGKARKGAGIYKAEELIFEGKMKDLKCVSKRKIGAFEEQIIFQKG
jgi:ubiquinone/menaquinone biosynthesis C-methylase UbiE